MKRKTNKQISVLSKKARQSKQERLFKSNFYLFSQVFPQQANVFSNYKPVSKLTYSRSGEYNIKFHKVNMYPEGSTTNAKDQLDNLEKFMFKLRLSAPNAEGLDPASETMIEPLLKQYNPILIFFDEGK